jgi:hypothetical protein
MKKKFFVHFKRNAIMTFSPEVLMQEQQRISELMRDHIVINVKMNKAMDNIWLEFRVESETELNDIIKTLPMCQNLYYGAYEIV